MAKNQSARATYGSIEHYSRAAPVLFGPTPVEFFGYPQNINLTAGDCAGCWRAAKDWFICCLRGFMEAECMNAHKVEVIVDAVLSLTVEKAGGVYELSNS